jgi:hypothetical protein
MSGSSRKPLMRSLGEFVGHIVKAVKTDAKGSKVVLNKTEQREERGNITLRRTTVEEIEIHDSKRS